MALAVGFAFRDDVGDRIPVLVEVAAALFCVGGFEPTSFFDCVKCGVCEDFPPHGVFLPSVPEDVEAVGAAYVVGFQEVPKGFAEFDEIDDVFGFHV